MGVEGVNSIQKDSSETPVRVNPKKPLLIIGVIFLVMAIMGIILSLSLPWFEQDIEGDSEKYNYIDFGDDFEENMGSRVDEYYHGSANLTLIGYILIIIIGCLFIFEYRKGKFSRIISNRLFKKSVDIKHSESISIFIVVVALLMIIPILLAIIGGTRLIGFTTMIQAQFDSEEVSEDYMEMETETGTFGTTAGYANTILGFIILIFCIFLLFREFSKINRSNESNTSKFSYIKKLKIIGLLLIILAIIGMVLIPVFTIMKLERKYIINEEFRNGYTYHFNDGIIHIWSSSGSGDKPDDMMENVDRDINLIFWSLALIIILSIILLFGLLLFSFDLFPRGSNLLMLLGCLLLIFCLVLLAGYMFMFDDFGALEKALQQQAEEYNVDSYYRLEENVIMGNNFAPLIMGIIILIIGLIYTYIVWPFAMPIIIGKPKEDVSGIRAAPLKFFAKPGAQNIIIVIVIVFALIIGSTGTYFAISISGDEGGGDSKPEIVDYHELPITSEEFSYNDYSSENTEYQINLNLNDTTYVNSVSMVLEWYDEPDESVRHENEPDEFNLILISPTGTYYESPVETNDKSSKYGIIEFTTDIIDPPEGWEEEEYFENFWVIYVMCGNCGDHEPRNFGLLQFNDSGNNWQLIINFDCYQYVEEQ